MSQNQPSPSKLAITIDYTTLRSLMLDYLNERNETEEIALHGDDDNNLSLERQLTLSGFLVWLRDKQKER